MAAAADSPPAPEILFCDMARLFEADGASRGRNKQAAKT
jgi:hypothetical protein